MKNIFTVLIVFLIQFSISGQNKENIWNDLLQNKREKALEQTAKIKIKKADLESLVLKNIVNEQNGIFTVESGFNNAFASKKDYDLFLFPLWNEKMFFKDYLEQDFDKEIVSNVNYYYNKNVKNSTVNAGLIYLKAITERHQNNFEVYKKCINDLHAISKWQFCGVFENLNNSGMDTNYPPENTAFSEKEFNANSNGKINWFTAGYSMDGYQFMRNHLEYGQGINYAQTFFTLPQEQILYLKLGTGVPTKLWVNDVLVFEETEKHITELDAHTIKIKIPKGNNRILVKLTNDNYSYFILRIFDENKHLIYPESLNFTPTFKDYNKGKLYEYEVLNNPFEDYFKNIDTKKITPFFKEYLLVKTYLRNGKTKKAKKIVLKYLEKYPKSSFLRSLLIIIAQKDKDYNLAKEISENRKNDDPNYMLVLLEEIQDTKKLFAMTPQEMQERLNKIKQTINLPIIQKTADLLLHLRTQEKEAFRADLDTIFSIAKEKQNPKLMTTYASFYAMLFNENEKSLKLYNDIYSNYFSYSAYKKLVAEYKKKNNKEKVEELYKNFITKLPDEINPIFNVTNFYLNNQKYNKALEQTDRGLQLFPYSFTMMKLKGDALFQLKKKKEALKWYKKSFSHDSGNASLRKTILDIEEKEDPIEKVVFKDLYKYIEKNRGRKNEKEYDFNILLDEQNTELFNEGGSKNRIISIYEVKTEKGIDRLKEYNLGLYYGYTINKSEIIKPDGKIVPAERSGSSFVFNGLSKNDVVLIDYETTSNNTGRFYKDFIDSYQFGTFYPNYRTDYRLIVPKGKKIYTKITNGTIPFKKEKIDNYTIYHWHQENPVILSPSEPYMPEINEIATTLHVGTIKDWSVISNWYSDLVRTQIEYDYVVNSTFDSIFKDGYKKLSDEQRAKKIYDYMMENLSYSYVSFKQSGYVPQKPSKTIKTKLGDCKDFSTLFVALAKKADLKSNLVLISTSDLGKNELVLPTTSFNHCIVRVFLNGNEQYLELTDKNLSFKTLPLSLEGALALNIPFYASESNNNSLLVLDNLSQNKTIIKNDIQLIIGKENFNLDNKVLTTGKLNSSYRELLINKNDEKLRKDLTKHFENRESLDLSLLTYEIIENDRKKDTVLFSTKFKVNDKLKKLGQFKLLKLPMFFKSYTDDIVNLEKRNYPIKYSKYEKADQYLLNYSILLNDGLQFVELPNNAEFNFKNHHFKIFYNKKKPNELTVKIIADIDRNDISTLDYVSYRKFVKNFLEAKENLIGIK